MSYAAKQRGRELARIHILKDQLGLDDETYHAIVWTQATVDSSAKTDEHGRKKIIHHLEQLMQRAGKPISRRPHNVGTQSRGELKKIEALLADAGRPWTYVESMARHMYRKQRVEFCSPTELRGLLTALERDAVKRLKAQLDQELKRQGLDWAFVASAATLLFGFDVGRRDLQKYAEVMSNTLRWLHGDIAPASAWPANLSQA